MIVHVYPLNYSKNKHHEELLRCFFVGLKRLGVESRFLDIYSYNPHDPPDYAVIFGTYKKSLAFTKPRKFVMENQLEHGKHTVVLDSGFVKRDFSTSIDSSVTYYSVGLDGINGRANFNLTKEMPPDRWKKLRIKLKDWREDKPDNHVLVCGQVPWDAATQHSDHLLWLQEKVHELTKATDRTILFSRHPKGPLSIHMRGVHNLESSNLQAYLEDCHATVCFNSNSGVESLIAGVPTFAFDQGSMCYALAGHKIEDIENPPMPDRQQWAYNLAYCQWTPPEMESGEAAKHILGL